LGKILSVPERIRLFKEINRVHRELYGWKMLYENASYGAGRINIEDDIRFDPLHEKWVTMEKSKERYYFHDNKGNDITSRRGIFAWEAYNFIHINPYKFNEFDKRLTEEDIITDSLGKRIRPNVNHPVDCLETTFEVQQRKNDEKIWISSNWIYHTDLYSSIAEYGNDIHEILNEAAGRDERISKELKKNMKGLPMRMDMSSKRP